MARTAERPTPPARLVFNPTVQDVSEALGERRKRDDLFELSAHRSTASYRDGAEGPGLSKVQGEVGLGAAQGDLR
jgi:hypothetical protein